MQQEIRTAGPLLDENGNLCQKGYAKSLVLSYDRSAIKAGGLRIKEWDYYYIGNADFGVALTIDDNAYMGLDSVSFLNFKEGWEVTKSPMQILTKGKKHLPASSAVGDVESKGKGYALSFRHTAEGRHLSFFMEDFKDHKKISGEIDLLCPADDTMVIATPFAKDGYFYYNQKINCMLASGEVFLGDERYVFNKEDAMGLLDWGRGVWTYKNTWYWGSASGYVGDHRFGFNIGYGFGDTSAASENMLFYDGKAHKLSQVTFNIPVKDGKEDYMSPWTFTSDDGRFEMDFVPVMDRASNTDFVVLGSDQHQVFGKFTGEAVLDDGTVIEIRDFMGFAEKVMNKW